MAEQLKDLSDDRALLGRTSTAERVSDILRSRIAEGFFLPGARLPEDSIGGALGVSRNTLREAFRLLAHERLLVHELNRGVFVRQLAPEDLSDLFQVRRLVELGALRGVRAVAPERLVALRAALDEARQCAADGRWMDVGTAN